MKKMRFVLVVLLLAAIPVMASAGVDNNPNSFELDMNCEGQIVHVTVPVINGEGGKVSDGRIAVSRTHYIDFDFDGVFEEDELVVWRLQGQGIRTTFCTWTWDNDPFVHGMDIQFLPANP
jgi:hypothetical protein